jgi:hypothetical protein
MYIYIYIYIWEIDRGTFSNDGMYLCAKYLNFWTLWLVGFKPLPVFRIIVAVFYLCLKSTKKSDFFSPKMERFGQSDLL